MEDTGAWELPSELVLLRDNLRRFMREEVCPAEETLEHDVYKMPKDLLAPLQKKAKDELGLWCINTPREYGGSELSLLAQAVVAEEAAQCRMGAYVPACGAIGVDPPNVIFDGSEGQIEKYGKRTIEKGLKAFVAISEPSGGADPARAIQCKAELVGNQYVLNGTKLWITGAEAAEWGIVFARTEAGITCFIVDKEMDGIETRPVPVIRSYSPSEVTFTDCKVPVENLLGEEGKGFAICQKWLVHARIPYSANVIGIAQRSLELAIEWARQRETFRSKLADKQAVQWMIADSEVEIRAARLLTYQAAWQGDLGHDIKVAASMAKLYSTEMAGRVVDRCMQIFGGMGVAAEMPLERWYREMRIKRIGEGPSEVHRMVIARDLLRG
ncbi:MAG: butyryl-CoA dehydrogenase [Rhodospirillaceae bacterium]|nr:butyryl-CoA dehydrogenase [Rhodospirillaceae bacterium]HAA91065.1 butyryl-CoA dehydrogenase [Rhodospirillaceae bacterium]